ncbi:hypothetical protein [Streptomyces specialis]|uniref:hypothetical protein n=1 Tax=Streptomyces specialis TaxID=498367 RepID=UPI000B23AF2A|nr:hypothetical protein [Streptomyces specialis]
MRLRSALVLAPLTLVLAVGGVSTASAATETAESPIDATLDISIDIVGVVGCVADAVETPTDQTVLLDCLTGR